MSEKPYTTFRHVVSEPIVPSSCDVWQSQSPVWGDMVEQENKEEQVVEEKPVVDKEWKRQKRRRYRKPVVKTVEDYISMLQRHKRPFVDFIIEKEAMCETMSNGEVCNKRCSKIHIQRCTHGDKCRSRVCTYIHAKDMTTDEGPDRFRETQKEYDERGSY